MEGSGGSYGTRDAGCENGLLGQLALVPVFERRVSNCFPQRGREGWRTRERTYQRNMVCAGRRGGICRRRPGGKRVNSDTREEERRQREAGRSILSTRGGAISIFKLRRQVFGRGRSVWKFTRLGRQSPNRIYFLFIAPHWIDYFGEEVLSIL